MAAQKLIAALKEVDPLLFSRLQTEITTERLYRYLQPLADTLAPSQTAWITRTPVLEQLLQADGLLDQIGLTFVRNYQQTGNSVLLLGKQPKKKKIWLLAHLDIISYLVVEPMREGRYSLAPLCYHMMHLGRRAAVATGYNLDACRFEVIARGELITTAENDVFFEPAEPVALHPGHRVCFHSQMTWNRASGELQGNLDDAGAVAALVLATAVLADYGIELMLGLTDEEEGVTGASNQTICRGGARLLRYFDQPELAIVSDIHEAGPMLEGHGPDNFAPGDGASFAECASRGRGTVTPPHLYALLRRLAAELATEGVNLRENVGGYVSRTEGVNAILRTPNVAILGFLGYNRHFEQDVTTANIEDLVNLARAVVCYVLLTQTSLWQEVMCLR